MGRWCALVLAVTVLTLGWQPAIGQTPEPADAGDLLRTVGLTQADVPPGLALDQSRTGVNINEEGRPSYTVAFMADGTQDTPIMGVVNIVSQYGDAAAGLERLTERFSTGLGGTPTEVPAPGLGEASRAFTVTNRVMAGALATSTAFVALRRRDVVAGVAVASLGETPQLDAALRLAQAVDGRLATALGPGS